MRKTDSVALLLMFVAVVILLLRDLDRQTRSEFSVNATEEGICPYCNWVSSAEGVVNRRRSLSAHTRQMHPREWAHIRSARQ